MSQAAKTNRGSPAPVAGSVEQIAPYLGLSRTSIFALIKSGRLPAARIGRRTLIRYADADALIAQSLQRPA